VRILVEIHLGTDGRPTGTVRAVDKAEDLPFSGNLEFLALIERLYQSEPARTDHHNPLEES
jgi:hypothetical protein